MKKYPLEINSIYGDIGLEYMSKGHHPIGEFVEAVSKLTDASLSSPEYVWMRVVPDPTGEYTKYYLECYGPARGAFPATICREI